MSDKYLGTPTAPPAPRIGTNVHDKRAAVSGAAAPAWWIVCTKELAELWIGGKALILTFIYTLLLGIWAYVLASNSELSLIPPKEMVYETLKAAIAVSLIICLIIGVDSVSGERERATLEGLLLTPTSRRQILVGKFLAAVSPWPVCLAITVPYWHVLAQGDAVFGQTVFWGAVVGSILALAFAGLGTLVSLWSNSNRTSMFVGLGLYVFFFLPTQLPGRAQTGAAGAFLQQANPLAAATHFLAKLLVNHAKLGVMWPWLVSPVLLAVLVVGVLFLSGGGLRLEARAGGRTGWPWGRAASVFAIACTLVFADPSSALALRAGWSQAAQALQIAIDVDYRTMQAGGAVLYNTVVTNTAAEASPALIVAMNIINLAAQGGVVDPEDWSPQRTQYLAPLAGGASASLAWRVNAILDGDYTVYMVLVPTPDGAAATSQPVASSALHLTVTPHTRINPGGVLPYALGGPLVAGLVMVLAYRFRRRQIETGGLREQAA